MSLAFKVSTEVLEIDEGRPVEIDLLRVCDSDDVLIAQTIDRDLLLTLTSAATECLVSVLKRQTLEAHAVAGYEFQPDWSRFFIEPEIGPGHSYVYVLDQRGEQRVILGYLRTGRKLLTACCAYNNRRIHVETDTEAFAWLKSAYEDAVRQGDVQ